MAKQIPQRPELHPNLAGETYAIVHSSYHAKYVDAMLLAAQEELLAIDPEAKIITIPAPGAYEIPVICKALALDLSCAAIIALGVILKGETAHAHLIAQSVTNSLQSLALETETPIIHEVLLLENERQAEERCLGGGDTKLNRGVEAARAAIVCVNSLALIETLSESGDYDEDDDEDDPDWLNEIFKKN
ncbi:MAG: 6,7-dimethyl-8-ribityllumazine synthase [Chthoniobacterales bacterium]